MEKKKKKKQRISKVNKVNFCDAFIMVTNATGLTDSMLNFFVKNDFNIIVSLDGPAEVHDALRKNCPHKTVLEVIKKIQDSPKKRLRYGGYYQYPQHSGYWETFIWEEGTGLIFYQSGYRDGVECIRLKKKGVKLPSDVWYD